MYELQSCVGIRVSNFCAICECFRAVKLKLSSIFPLFIADNTDSYSLTFLAPCNSRVYHKFYLILRKAYKLSIKYLYICALKVGNQIHLILVLKSMINAKEEYWST